MVKCIQIINIGGKEVWEISDEVFELMRNMSDEEFERLCLEGMW